MRDSNKLTMRGNKSHIKRKENATRGQGRASAEGSSQRTHEGQLRTRRNGNQAGKGLV